jgi:hypothetical protein
MRLRPALLLQIASLVVASDAGCDLSACGDDPSSVKSDVDSLTVCHALALVCRSQQECARFEGLSTFGWTQVEFCDPADYRGCNSCLFPNDYITAYVKALPSTVADASPEDASDAGDVEAGVDAAADATPDADAGETPAPPPPVCPSWTGWVTVGCQPYCEGRRTRGMRMPTRRSSRTAGEYFAQCSHLEAVSVFAFARLERELEAHGAPHTLVEAARRARRDEVRHARIMRRLARRHGCEPERARVDPVAVRSLFEVALENAIEGCIRETLGAVTAYVRAMRAIDPDVRAAFRSIAEDECAHAALSWRIAAWARRSLTADDRARLRRSMRDEVHALLHASDDMDEASRAESGAITASERRRIVAMLDAAVYRRTA